MVWWTRGELNPQCVNANDVLYRLTTSPGKLVVHGVFYQELGYNFWPMAEYEFSGFGCEHMDDCHTGVDLFLDGKFVIELKVDEDIDVDGLHRDFAEELRQHRGHQRAVAALKVGMQGKCASDCEHSCGEIEIVDVVIPVFKPVEPRKNGTRCEAPNLLR